jgi:hypothetical protein
MIARWVVRCEHPNSSDVIENRARPYIAHHETAESAFADAAQWYRSGPNGPARTAEVYRDGVRVTWGGLDMGPPVYVRLDAVPLAGRWRAKAILPDGTSAAVANTDSDNAETALLRAGDWLRFEPHEVVIGDCRRTMVVD